MSREPHPGHSQLARGAAVTALTISGDALASLTAQRAERLRSERGYAERAVSLALVTCSTEKELR